MMVSVILPYIRPEGAQRCIDAIRANAGMDERFYEIVAQPDNCRIGVPKMVKRLVSLTFFENVMFLADDTIPQPDFMVNACKAMASLPGGWGMVGLNDQFHDGNNLATHWMCGKRLLEHLDGEFFHTGYRHCFCDNELITRAKELGRYIWADDAYLIHDHPIVKREQLSGTYAEVYRTDNYQHDRRLFERRKANGWTTPPRR